VREVELIQQGETRRNLRRSGSKLGRTTSGKSISNNLKRIKLEAKDEMSPL
jgi:hypothetical protein